MVRHINPALNKIMEFIRNPLSLIAVFAGLAEVAATVALTQLESPVQDIFVWFVMLFPTLLVVLFFLTLNFNHTVLYAPGDYSNERYFQENASTFKTQQTRSEEHNMGGTSTSLQDDSPSSRLRTYWKQGNEDRIKTWMQANNIVVDTAFFLYDSEYEEERLRALSELGLDERD